MSILALFGVGLGLGWVGLWFLMHRNVQSQLALEKKIEELEKRHH